MTTGNVVLVGHCAVDSGQIMITDPCYVIGDDFTQKDYEAVCEITLSDEHGGFPFEGGHDGKAVVTSSGIGDGYYPVYVTYMDVDGFGRRVASLTIDFSDHVLLEEEE